MPQFDTPINTNDQSIGRVLGQSLPVILILDLGADKATLDTLAKQHVGKLLIVRVNPSESPATARQFNQAGLVVWKEGKVAAQIATPTSDHICQAAAFAIGKGEAPKETPPKTNPGASVHAHPIKVDESSFAAEVLHSDQPVLVDFWAAWCGPCRTIAPTLEKLAGEFQGQVRIAKLNVDENPRLAAQYGASAIPQLTIFKGGKPVDQLVGAHPEPAIRAALQRALR
jgi:thioredoxin 1